MRKYSGACAILALADDKNANLQIGSKEVALWKLALHFVYTQYADGECWPLPTKKLQSAWLKRFGGRVEIREEDRFELYKIWREYLEKNINNEKRWLPKNPQLG